MTRRSWGNRRGRAWGFSRVQEEERVRPLEEARASAE